ncbi:MAG: ribosome maturation factor RimM [Hydrogenovibrio sp.]|nr:ribosome maturation factor RimM [Hydrogenovibrio sp.]
MEIETADKLIVGQINGIFGVKGWVKVFSHTDPRENILTYSPWLVKHKGVWKSMDVTDGQVLQGGKAIVARLAGVDDRDIAREYMGCDIAILPEQLPDADDGYYWRQLIGCQVTNLEGDVLGKVTSLVETGAHDVLRVESDQGSTLIPFVEDKFIIDVDVDHKQIKVDWQLEDESSADVE